MTEDMTGFLLDQFEDLADAPGGVQRLREMILQLAVTGRLGTGDCKEKSLSAILENISINQNKSGKNGIIDKSKYEKLNWKIPENWIWSSLGNICQKISNGYSGQQNKNCSEYPLTRIETISLGFIDFNRVGFIHNPGTDIIEKYSLKKGDILMSHINSDKHLGKTAIFNNDRILLHGTNLLLIRLFPDVVCPEFINIYFNNIRNNGFF